MQFAMIDGTIVKVHRHDQSEKGVVKPSQKITLQHASWVRFPDLKSYDAFDKICDRGGALREQCSAG